MQKRAAPTALLVLGLCALLFYTGHTWHGSRAASSDSGPAPAAEPIIPADPDTGTSPPQDLLKIMASVPSIQPATYSMQDLQNVFPEFQHRPFDRAGFNAVILPFKYEDPDHLGTANEALALDALISNDLDWSPGCYCARHAYFVFKRDRELIEAVENGYPPRMISLLMRRWGSTHAVGGKLIRTQDGYKGELELFDRHGQLIYIKSYPIARSYWDLLGDIDVDAMTCMDQKPSDKLAAYLHLLRCRQQSVIDFGSAAFMDERSPGEFGTYQKILQVDPGFAMVRYWYANQQYWQDYDAGSLALRIAEALSSRIEPSALLDFDPRNCADKTLAAGLPDWVDRAADLASEDSPFVLSARLNAECYGGQSLEQICDRARRAAAQYPNAFNLEVALSYRIPDPSMQCSLLLSSLLDNFSPGSGSKADEENNLALVSGELGRNDVAMELLDRPTAREPGLASDILLISLVRAGHYQQAADLYPRLAPPHTGFVNPAMPSYAAFAAVMTRNLPLLDRILREQREVLAGQQLSDVFQAFRDSMTGNKFDLAPLPAGGKTFEFGTMWALLLTAAYDASQGSSAHHSRFTIACNAWPANRLLWIAQDNYQRRDPSRDAAEFYDYLNWFYGDDPWVARAVADFHQRGGASPSVDPDILRADLQEDQRTGRNERPWSTRDWTHVTTAWRVVAGVHQLLQQNKTDQASEIAALYLKTVSNPPRYYPTGVAHQLINHVNQWVAP